MRAGRILAVVVVATATVAPLAAPAARAAETAPAVLTVAPSDGGVVRNGRPLDVDVRITNTGTQDLAAGDLALSLGTGPVASSSALLSQLAQPPEALQGQLLTRTSARSASIPVGATATVSVRIPAKDLDETLTSADGARLLDVQLTAAAGGDRVTAFGRSVLTRMSGDARRIGFGTVVPVTIPAGTTGIVDTATQADLTASDGAWTEALEAARAMPAATIALDPAVIASIRLAGSAAPSSATAFLDELRDVDNETVRLAYADGDVTLQRAAGLAAPLAPVSFAGASAADSPSPTDAATPAATPAPTTGTSAEDLTEWDWSRTRIVWPVPGTTTQSDLAPLGRSGTLLLGSSDLQATTALAAAGPLASVSQQPALVADSTASALLASATDDGPDGRSAAASLTAVLATDAVTGAAPALLAVAGRGVDAAGLARVLGVLDRQGWIRGEGLGSLADQTRATQVLLKGGSISTARATTAGALVSAESAVSRVAEAAADPAALRGPYRLALLGVLSAQWSRDERGWASAASTARSAFDAMPRRISIVDPGPLTSVGTDGRLRVTVRNQLSQPVKVVVTATLNNNRLKFDSPGQVTVAANSYGPTSLSFRSISNGPAVVTLSLATPQGVRFGAAQEQAVTVRAGFDTIVAVILLTALGLLLALGVYRNVLRRRRPKAEA